MPRTPTNESVAAQALRDGDTEVIGSWVRNALPAVVPERLAAPVVRHPLEFICLPLHRSGKVGLCLHVWPENDDTTSPVIHAHSWDLWSYVVCGTVQNQIVSIHDEADTPDYGLYTVTSTTGGVDEVQATGRLVTCVPRQRKDVRSGQIYRLPAGLFHRSGHRGMTATLVLGEQHEGRENLILGPLNGYPWHDSRREECSPDEARELLRRVVMRC